MLDFLSREWVAALDDAATGVSLARSDGDPEPVTLQQVVIGVEGGECAYYLLLANGLFGVRPGRAENPTVSFTTDLVTARAIARGEQSAQTAFIQGRLRLGGDVHALVRYAGDLSHLDEAFAVVRERTTY